MGKLDRKYGRDLVIIGVQSPKYPAEAIPENLRAAVHRLEIEHPVVNDPDHRVWDSYAVTAWPTLVFISPRGEVLGSNAGEVPFEALDRVVGEIVRQYDAEGELSARSLDLEIQQFSRPLNELSFPGKVLATPHGLFIADSDHHRIVITDLEGKLRDIAGSGRSGLKDGNFQTSEFHSPQGMALAENDVLYVADAETHTIRAIDLNGRQVTTVAGTGEQTFRVRRNGPARETPLNSPFDLALDGTNLYIAMAGSHQIWQLDLQSESIGVWAGTGHEGIRDGTRETAWLAQPVGLALHDNLLYVSCCETQAVRVIDTRSGSVQTVVGRGLFDFGDLDGPASSALLQHNQGVAVYEGRLFIADTYNNNIRTVDLATNVVSTYAGSGQRGTLDGPGANARFDEPAGICLLESILYIADTNNHLIRMVDLDSGHVRTLRINGL